MMGRGLRDDTCQSKTPRGGWRGTQLGNRRQWGGGGGVTRVG